MADLLSEQWQIEENREGSCCGLHKAYEGGVILSPVFVPEPTSSFPLLALLRTKETQDSNSGWVGGCVLPNKHDTTYDVKCCSAATQS